MADLSVNHTGHRWTKPGPRQAGAGVCICNPKTLVVAMPLPVGRLEQARDDGAKNAGHANACPDTSDLFAQSKPPDDLLISGTVFARQVFQ